MSLKELLKGDLPENRLPELPNGFEVIGDIAIVNLPRSLDNYRHLIAKAIVSHRKDVRTVLCKINKLKGEKRIAGFEILSGTGTETFHRENNCTYFLDVTRTYFSTRLAYERNRIADIVSNGEDILVMFCGAGPFLIPIKKKNDVRITGIDNNPDACYYLKKNLDINNVEGNVILSSALNNIFKRPFDRIVMPTPYGQDYFLDNARDLIRQGGIVHFYTFKKDFEFEHFRKLLEKRGWKIIFTRKCGNVAPRVARYVFDMEKM